MAGTLRTAVVRFVARTDNYEQGLKRIQNKTNAVFGHITRIVAAAGVAIAASARAYAQFEAGLAGVQKTSGLTGRALDSLGKDIRRLSKQTGFSSVILLEIAQAAAQLGIQGRDNILEYTRVIAEMGVATDLSGEQAAFALARISNVTGESAQNVRHLASTIVGLGNNFAATESEIAESTVAIAAATAAYGVASHQAAALGTVYAASGQQIQASATGTTKVMAFMNKAVLDGGETLKTFAKITGTTEEQFIKLFRDNSAMAFAKFIEGLSKTGDEMDLWLAKVGLTDIRTNKVLKALTKNSGEVARALELANKEFQQGTALGNEYLIFSQTLMQRWERLKQTVVDLGIEIGQRLEPGLSNLFEEIKIWISDNASSFANTIEAYTLGFRGLRLEVQLFWARIAGSDEDVARVEKHLDIVLERIRKLKEEMAGPDFDIWRRLYTDPLDSAPGAPVEGEDVEGEGLGRLPASKTPEGKAGGPGSDEEQYLYRVDKAIAQDDEELEELRRRAEEQNEILRVKLATDDETMAEFYEREFAIKEMWAEAERARDEEHKQQLEERARLHEKILAKDKEKYAKAREKQLKLQQMREMSAVAGHLSQIFGQHTAFGKALFVFEKGVKIAETLAETEAGATQAYQLAVQTYPPPKGEIIGQAAMARAYMVGYAGVAAIAASAIQGVAAEKGTRVPGNKALGDVYPHLLSAGETVVPDKNYDDLVQGILMKHGQRKDDDMDDPMTLEVDARVDLTADAGKLVQVELERAEVLST